MIHIKIDGESVYNSRVADTPLLGLTTTKVINKGGTAVLRMTPGHPLYDRFTAYRSIVELYRDGALRFRGRPLPPRDDYYNIRTLTCEGEMCFFRDAVSRPYVYQTDPASIFATVIGIYNTQVEPDKQFLVGEITVTDPNDYVRLESESAEQVLDTINKLLERCGGYIVFTTNADGRRVVNWYETLGYRSNQVIKFGENLLDFMRDGGSTDIATGILPYGAKDEQTGLRVSIESVNDGLDFIQDDEAVALRGFILKPMVWDDVTEPANLLRKAQQALAESRHIITSLQLSALDISYMDKKIDSFLEGDTIHVESKPHKVDDDYVLWEKTEDWLVPDNSTITLGKDVRTLTGADVAGDNKGQSELHQIKHEINSMYTVNVQNAIQQAQQTLSTLIQQTSEALRLEVEANFATNGAVEELVRTSMTQLADSFEFMFTELRQVVDTNDADARDQFQTIEKHIRFIDGKIILGEVGNELELNIANDRISFCDGGAEVAYFSNKQLVVLDGNFLNSLQIGPIAYIPRKNGNTSIVRVGVD